MQLQSSLLDPFSLSVFDKDNIPRALDPIYKVDCPFVPLFWINIAAYQKQYAVPNRKAYLNYKSTLSNNFI